jgi:hypothetical protein
MHTITREVKRLLYEKKLRERFGALREAQDMEEAQFKKKVVEPEGHWSMTSDDPKNPIGDSGTYKSHSDGIKAAEKIKKNWKVSAPTKKSQDPTRAARPFAKKKPAGFAEGGQPEQRINLAEAEENPLIGAIEGVVKNNPLAFGLEEAPEPAIIRAMIEPMVAAAMQAGMAAVASSPGTRGDNSGPALVKNPLTET